MESAIHLSYAFLESWHWQQVVLLALNVVCLPSDKNVRPIYLSRNSAAFVRNYGYENWG